MVTTRFWILLTAIALLSGFTVSTVPAEAGPMVFAAAMVSGIAVAAFEVHESIVRSTRERYESLLAAVVEQLDSTQQMNEALKRVLGQAHAENRALSESIADESPDREIRAICVVDDEEPLPEDQERTCE